MLSKWAVPWSGEKNSHTSHRRGEILNWFYFINARAWSNVDTRINRSTAKVLGKVNQKRIIYKMFTWQWWGVIAAHRDIPKLPEHWHHNSIDFSLDSLPEQVCRVPDGLVQPALMSVLQLFWSRLKTSSGISAQATVTPHDSSVDKLHWICRMQSISSPRPRIKSWSYRHEL